MFFEAELVGLIITTGHLMFSGMHFIIDMCSYVARKTSEEFLKLTGNVSGFED